MGFHILFTSPASIPDQRTLNRHNVQLLDSSQNGLKMYRKKEKKGESPFNCAAANKNKLS